MAKQPTATAFTRTQESWALHVLNEKVRPAIDERQTFLRNKGTPESKWDSDPILMNLYADEEFWERYADEMIRQREYIKEHFND